MRRDRLYVKLGVLSTVNLLQNSIVSEPICKFSWVAVWRRGQRVNYGIRNKFDISVGLVGICNTKSRDLIIASLGIRGGIVMLGDKNL